MTAGAPRHRQSFLDYLQAEEMSAVKHEYLDGEIWAMVGGTPEHAALCAALIVLVVATAPCDPRKHFDGLAVMVEQGLRHDPRSGHLFLVFNRREDQVRILFWNRQGYCLFAKRLECRVLAVPRGSPATSDALADC